MALTPVPFQTPMVFRPGSRLVKHLRSQAGKALCSRSGFLV